MLNLQSLRMLFLIASVVLFGIAYSFGTAAPYQQVVGQIGLGDNAAAQNVAIAANGVAGLASFGFAIAGGLSLLAAAIVGSRPG